MARWSSRALVHRAMRREGCLDDLRQVRHHFLQREAGVVTVFGVAGEHVHVLADQRALPRSARWNNGFV